MGKHYLCIAMVYKFILFLVFLAHTDRIMCQVSLAYDTIIDRGIYQSYFSRKYSTVSFVRYKLFKGGGNCTRSGIAWRKTVGRKVFHYPGSGYDKGHLAAAQDFAYDCDALRRTFDYINALPQRPALNRGEWKRIETQVRKRSRTDTVYVECGGLDFAPPDYMVPTYFYKIVTVHQGRDTIINVVLPNK